MIISLLGPPGSGKGTVATTLAKKLKAYHLSPGELLREEVKLGTTLGKEIKKYIEAGNLVPDHFVTEMVKLTIHGKKKVILDGYPRNLAEAKDASKLGVSLVIYLKVPQEVILQRLAKRRVCSQGHNYHLKHFPPKQAGICDIDGTKLKIRKDDHPNIIQERFNVFQKQTLPVVRYFKRKKMVQTIDGAGAPKDVLNSVTKIIKKGV